MCDNNRLAVEGLGTRLVFDKCPAVDFQLKSEASQRLHPVEMRSSGLLSGQKCHMAME